jgi:hypothetical protein
MVRHVIAWGLAAAALLIRVPAPLACAAPVDIDALSWEVQYLIDQTQTVLGYDQVMYPRANRGLAVTPDGRTLYAGYNFPIGNPEVRKIDLVRNLDGTPKDYTDATLARLPGRQGKATAVDDAGRVYLAEGASIRVYDADLTTELFAMTGADYGFGRCDGVAVARERGALALYATDRDGQALIRWELTESGPGISVATPAGLGGTGRVLIAGASDLRGLELDPLGRIWMADIGADQVFRLNNDGTGLDSASVDNAIDVGIDDGVVFVTQYTDRTITLLDYDLAAFRVLTPAWAALGLDPDGNPLHGYGEAALAGIAVLPGVTLYVANQGGQTANEKSTYGRDDSFSGLEGGLWYTDLSHDDNDPILTLSAYEPGPEPVIPEPATLALLGLAALHLLRRRR